MLSKYTLKEIIFSLAKNLNDAKMGIAVKIDILKTEVYKAPTIDDLVEIIFLLIIPISGKSEMLILEEEIWTALDKAGIEIPTNEIDKFTDSVLGVKYARLLEETKKELGSQTFYLLS